MHSKLADPPFFYADCLSGIKKRLFIFLFLLGSLTGYGQERKVTLSLQKSSIHTLFKQIQAQSGYTFIYSDDVVSDTILISAMFTRTPVSRILEKVLPEKQLFHQLLSEKMIVVGSVKRLKKAEESGFRTMLSGYIVNADGQAIPFATLALLENTVQVNGAVATDRGEFQFPHALKPDKTYQLSISSLSYEPLKVRFAVGENRPAIQEFGKLQLKAMAKNLKTVNVTAPQNVIEMDGGNIIFNVSKSISAQGLNVLELLSRAPGVMVSADHKISLNGKAGAAVLIDGKQTYLSNREMAELLKSMSSSSVKSIEIINSPNARYDAAGTAGIINVQTAKTTTQGFSSAFTTGLSYGVYLRNNQDLSFSYRKNKLNLFGNYNHFFGYYSYLYGADRLQEDKFYNSFTDDIDKRKKMGSRLGADYSIDQNNTIGVLLNGNFIFGGGITDTRTEIGQAYSDSIDQVLTAINDYYYMQTQRYNLNLNYKYEDSLGRMINVDADYGDFTKRAGNLQSNTYAAADQTVLSDNLYRSLNGIDIGLRAVKADYTTNLWKGKIDVGAKYSSVSSANDSKFLEIQPAAEVLDPSRSNRFVYREHITSAYVNYKKDIKKWQFQAGLRVENAGSAGKLDEISPIAGNLKRTTRNYTHFFPFFSAGIKPAASHSFSLSYSRRIDRPAYQNLNPFIYLLDELSYWQGNPFLQPQLSHRGLFQYVYKNSTIMGLSYTYTDNFSVEVTDTVGQNKIVMVPRNLGVQQHLALTLTQTLHPKKWWNLTFNGTFFGLMNRIDFGADRKLNPRQAAVRVNLQQNFRLPYALNAEVVATYNSRRLAGATQFSKPSSQVDLGIQRNFIADKATLRLVFSDIYKGNKGNSIQSVPGLYIHNYSYFETRQVKLNFSYRIISGNSKGPRNRTSALENENGRIK